MDYIKEYSKQVESGQIIVCKKIKKLLKLITKMLVDDRFYYNSEKVEHVIGFVEKFCRQSTGTIDFIKLMLWQKFVIAILFGIQWKEKQVRVFREVFLVVARKNGKSTFLSALALYMLTKDGEFGSKVYTLATNREQAKIVFESTKNMVELSPKLNKHIKKRKSDLYYKNTLSIMEPLSKETKSLDGKIPHMWIIDECHAITDRKIYDVMKSSNGAKSRRQPLGFIITTAGYERENIYDDLYDYSEKILDGIIEDFTFLPIIFELDERSEWTKPEMWFKSNPGLGVIRDAEELMTSFRKAQNSPTSLPEFLTKYCNIRESSTQRWINFETIDKNNKEYPLDMIKGKYCTVGIDLSQITDLTAVVFLIPLPNGEKFVIPHFFIAEEQAKRKIEEDRVPYDIWKEKGFVTFTEGYQVNYEEVEQWIIKTSTELNLSVVCIGYDMANANYIINHLVNKYGYTCDVVRQGAITFSIPMQVMEADIESHKMVHNNNTTFKWCLSNTNVERDKNNNMRPIKDNSKMRIDGMVAALNAYVVYDRNQQVFDYVNMLEASS